VAHPVKKTIIPSSATSNICLGLDSLEFFIVFFVGELFNINS
jgi:hypothetical protein